MRFLTSIFLVFAFYADSNAFVCTRPEDFEYNMNPLLTRQCSWYDVVSEHEKSNETAEIVFIGDSLVKLGNWSILLDKPVVNRGIGGDTSALVYERIWNIQNTHAKTAYLLVGINDMYRGSDSDTSLPYYLNIIESLKSFGMHAVVISVIMCNAHYSNGCQNLEHKINRLNYQLSSIEGIDFIDANTELSDSNGLKSEYTTDGVHLNNAGYHVLANLIRGTHDIIYNTREYPG